MRVTTRLALLAAGIATPLALALPGASATTTACVIGRYDLKLWMRDLKEGAAYLPK
jgi:hypothetical protein